MPPCLSCMSIVFYFSLDHCNNQERERKKKREKVVQREGQTRCIMGDVLKNKKEKISCFESHFLRDQDFSTPKKKKKNGE